MRDDDTAGGNPRVITDGTAGTCSADEATERQLRQGYIPLHERLDDQGLPKGSPDPFGAIAADGYGFGDEPGGFLDRPHGWER